MHFNIHLMNFINEIIVYRIDSIVVDKIQNVTCVYQLTEGLIIRFLRLVENANNNQFADFIFLI